MPTFNPFIQLKSAGKEDEGLHSVYSFRGGPKPRRRGIPAHIKALFCGIVECSSPYRRYPCVAFSVLHESIFDLIWNKFFRKTRMKASFEVAFVVMFETRIIIPLNSCAVSMG